MSVIFWIVTLVTHGLGAAALSRFLGLGWGLCTYAAANLLASLLAGLLLSNAPSSPLGNTAEPATTWRNRVAGWLLPWGGLFAPGSLMALVLKNAVVGMVFGSAVISMDQIQLLDQERSIHAAKAEQIASFSPVLTWIMVTCWLAMLIAWGWMTSVFFKHRTNAFAALKAERRFWGLFVVPPLLIGISMLLKVSGNHSLAFLSAVVPVAVAGVPLLLFMMVFLIPAILGKPIRWN